jgi:leader peptidase (prepilin peptidase)/N-methyltransferase
MLTGPFVFELPAFLLGLLLGSFLNVCISRLPEHRSINKPRSHCPHCLATISWYDNIPILSWILLRGHCRNCQQRISWRYPAVELSFGIWLAFAAHTVRAILTQSLPANAFASHFIDAIAFAILGFLLIGLLVMDWQTHTLPNTFTLTGTIIAFVLICARALLLNPHQYDLLLHGRDPLSSPGNVVDNGNVVLTGPEHLVLGRLLAITLAAGILLLIRFAYKGLRHREGLGFGDIKLIAMLAAFMGFWPTILALFLGVVLCSAYAIALMIGRRANASTRLPLGAFLAIGGLITALLGTPLIAWYTSLL